MSFKSCKVRDVDALVSPDVEGWVGVRFGVPISNNCDEEELPKQRNKMIAKLVSVSFKISNLPVIPFTIGEYHSPSTKLSDGSARWLFSNNCAAGMNDKAC